MQRKSGYDVVGLMSGTSCDGLDLAFCRLYRYRNRWHYRILRTETYGYAPVWTKRLGKAAHMDAQDFVQLHIEYGRYLGQAVKKFLGKGAAPDLIASHGHTIFHMPESGLTFQLGDGACIAAVSGITTVSDFRGLDLAHGGQGAPLVPVGDEMLFGEYDACLNLGGFANISYRKGGNRLAFDICPVNTILNNLAAEKGLGIDEDGRTGRTGRIDEDLVSQLNGLSYYRITGPKSLGREWLESTFMPVVRRSGLKTEDKLRSVYEHIRQQIVNTFRQLNSPVTLLTGGGTFNSFLVELVQQSATKFVIPDRTLVKYKEALVFAFLGLLRYRGEINCLASATGADKNLKAGVIHAA